MGLLNDLEAGKMGMQSLNGETPKSYNTVKPNGATSIKDLKENAGLDPVVLKTSTLDLDGHTPKKYLDNLPS